MDYGITQSCGLSTLSLSESCNVTGGSKWDLAMSEYLGMGIGYGLKKCWKAFQFMSKNLYSLDPRVLYQ